MINLRPLCFLQPAAIHNPWSKINGLNPPPVAGFPGFFPSRTHSSSQSNSCARCERVGPVFKHNTIRSAPYSFKPHRICPCASWSNASRTGPISVACIRICSLIFSDSSTTNLMSISITSHCARSSAPAVLCFGCVAGFIFKPCTGWTRCQGGPPCFIPGITPSGRTNRPASLWACVR